MQETPKQRTEERFKDGVRLKLKECERTLARAFGGTNRKSLERTFLVSEERTRQETHKSHDGVIIENVSFTAKRLPTAQEQKTLKDVLDVVCEVPEGKKLLDRVAGLGYSFCFENSASNTAGCMYPDDKTIVLNPSGFANGGENPQSEFNTAAMAVTLYHEMVHAVQNRQSRDMMTARQQHNFNTTDRIMFNRVCEAAAYTEESRFIHQIIEHHPEIREKSAKTPTYQAFCKEMAVSGDMDKAGEKAFKAWYADPFYQNAYEHIHVENIAAEIKIMAKRKIRSSPMCRIPPERALDHAFVSNGIRDCIPSDFPTSPQAFALSKGAVGYLDRVNGEYAPAVQWARPDTSYRQMYAQDGKPRAPAPVRQSLMSKLKEIAGITTPVTDRQPQKLAVEPKKAYTPSSRYQSLQSQINEITAMQASASSQRRKPVNATDTAVRKLANER